MRKAAYFIPVAVLAVAGVLSSVFVVDERQKALVLQFGQIRQVVEEPGLGFKIPLIQEVAYYDDRILSLDTEEIEVTPSDNRRLVVDAFARYRIVDVVQFRQAVGVGGIRAAEGLLQSILNAQIRQVLGADQVTSDTILSTERRELMNRIRDNARAEALAIGLDVVDVRLKQTNLPAQNLEPTFARMRAEREREATDEIARGNEAALGVRALADRTVVETVSAAEREAQILRGAADAEASAIFADSFGANPEFFQFYRSMQLYEQALGASGATMVMTPDNDLFSYLYSSDRIEGVPTEGPAPTEISTREPEPVEIDPMLQEIQEATEEGLSLEPDDGADAAPAPDAPAPDAAPGDEAALPEAGN